MFIPFQRKCRDTLPAYPKTGNAPATMSTTLQKKKPPTVREGEPRAPVALQLGDVLDLSDDALLRLAALNDTLHLERDAEGRLVIMPPPGHASSRRNSEIVAELIFWNRAQGEPGVVSGPDGGFRLPSGAVRTPDAAWLDRERYDACSGEEQERYLPLCPDFLVELRSRTDRVADLQAKMEEYRAAGCRLGWLLDPFEEDAHVYRPGQPPERVASFDETLTGDDVLSDFELSLDLLR